MGRERTFIAILASSDGTRRFRTAVLAEDVRHARKQAERTAFDMPGIAVELIFPQRDDADGEVGGGNEMDATR